MPHTNDPQVSRRGFLRWFSSESVVTVGHTLTASVPLLGGILTAQKQPCASLRAVDEGGAQARCTRCYAPFNPESDQSLCPDCRATEVKNQALLRDLFKGRSI